MPKKSSSPDNGVLRAPLAKSARPAANAARKRQFRETARDILHMAKVKRQRGEAVDAAGAVASAMERAYRLGFEEALQPLTPPDPAEALEQAGEAESDAMAWTLIPARTRSTFWSICLAALGRAGRTTTPSYLKVVTTRAGRLAWQLVVPDRQTYEKQVGDGTITTLFRLGLMDFGDDEDTVILTDYGIRTWNRFCERGGHWPDDLVEKLP
jgi:hypothetical protein